MIRIIIILLLLLITATGSTQIRSFLAPVDSNYCFSIACAEKMSKSVKYLDLERQPYIKFENEYQFCKTVSHISLIADSLETMPAFLFKCSKLESVLIGGNKLKSIEKEIKHLSGLKSLNCCDNELTDLPREMKHLKQLRFISLQSNKLRHIPKVLYSMKSLKHLVLIGNMIPDNEILEFIASHPETRVDYLEN
jgi:hypothetical protein